jgi:hypothetical protein
MSPIQRFILARTCKLERGDTNSPFVFYVVGLSDKNNFIRLAEPGTPGNAGEDQ